MAVNNMGRPSEFFYCFQSAFAEEYHTLCIIVEEMVLVVAEYCLAFEIILVIHEIYLQAGIRQRGHFNDERVIVFINNNVDTGEANYLVEAVATLINDPKARHDDTYFQSGVESFDCQLVEYLSEIRKLGIG